MTPNHSSVWKLALATAMAVPLTTGCGDGSSPAGPEDDGTDAMIQRLDSLQRTVDPKQNAFMNRARSELIRRNELQRTPDPVLVRLERLAGELLRAGAWQEGASVLESALDSLARERGEVPSNLRRGWGPLLGTLHLREAIERRCVEGERPDLCAVPMDSGASSDVTALTREAYGHYAEMMRFEPWSRVDRWLTNLAAMVGGEFPEGVQETWRLRPTAFDAEEDLGRFRDRARELGLDVRGHAGSSVLEDFDGDGDLDVMVSSWAPGETLRYYRNEGDDRFTERTVAAGLTGLRGGLNLKQADYDNDGDVDVLVLRGGWQSRGWPNSLLRNDGDGTFTDVTRRAGLLYYHPTQTAAWSDYDNDGDLDLYVGNETSQGPDSQAHPSRLHRNEGDGTFTDVAPEAGMDVLGMVKGVAWGDYDNDGRPDLYVSRLDGANRLFHNEGPDDDGVWRFRDVAEEAGVTAPEVSFPVWFFDYDNDGWQDLYVASKSVTPRAVVSAYMEVPWEAETARLYRNEGDGTFTDVTSGTGLNRPLLVGGSNFGDLDNDGFLDLFLGTGGPDMRALVPTRVFRNDAGRRFREVTTSGGFGHIGKGAGVSFGDVDGDGDQDVYAVYGGAYEGDVFRNALYENPGHGHRWLTLRLEGREANRDGIDARIRVVVEAAGGGEREIHVTAGSGASFGASSLQQEIGLGEAVAVRSVEIRWPGSGTVDEYGEVEMDRIYEAREGAGELRAVAADSVELAPGDGSGDGSGERS